MTDKITIERETLERAIAYLEAPTAKLWPAGTLHGIAALLRAALAAQPAEAQQEPVAWLRFQEHADSPTTVHLCDSDHPRAFQVYAAQPAPAAVPLGWKLVPLEPFPSQRIAGAVALMKASDSDLDCTTDEIAAAYRAMIAAAVDKP